jgi:DNA-binding NarL/FixJ family response regulator
MPLESTPASDPLRIVLADDHAFFRDGLARILSGAGIEVVAQVANGEAAVESAVEHAPDVVVMDLSMPGISGLEATRRLQQRAPACRVLVLTVSDAEADVIEAVVAGASGYVLKDGPTDEVIHGIRLAAMGHCLISPRVATLLLERLRGEAEPVLAGAPLSSRELEVLELIADGKTDYEIADELAIGPASVRNHVSNILLKLQVENRVQAAVRAFGKR